MHQFFTNTSSILKFSILANPNKIESAARKIYVKISHFINFVTRKFSSVNDRIICYNFRVLTDKSNTKLIGYLEAQNERKETKNIN